MSLHVDVREAMDDLDRLVERVAAGERVVICRDGRPVADLVAHRPNPIVFGGMRDVVSYDDATFGELDPEIQRMFYGSDAVEP